MAGSIKAIPEPTSDLDTASLEELRAEVLALRTWCSNTFLQVKEFTTRMNDLAAAAEQGLALKSNENASYVDLSNKVEFLIGQNTDLSNKVTTLQRTYGKMANLDTQLTNSNITLVSRLNQLNADIQLIMQALGLDEGDNEQ